MQKPYFFSALLLLTYMLCFAPQILACDEFLDPKSLIAQDITRAREFLDKYGEPNKLDRFLVATRIKKELDRLGVSYTEKNHSIIIQPIRKEGLNEFAFEMARFKNTRVAFNMHTYSDRTAPSRDDYFQAYSDSTYTNLVLSEQFLKEVVLGDDWIVSEWLNNARTYLSAYNRPNENLLATNLFKKDHEDDLGMDEKIRSHITNMDVLIYNLLRSNSDEHTFKEATDEITKFGYTVHEIVEFIRPILSKLKINSLFSSNHAARYMELNLIDVGSSSYKVLVSLNVDGSRISFYLKDKIKDPYKTGWLGGKRLTTDALQTIRSHALHHLRELYVMIDGLRILINNTKPSDSVDILQYNQKLLGITSLENKEFYY